MKNLIGLTLEEARSLLSAEERDYRVNLEIENNIVVRVYGG